MFVLLLFYVWIFYNVVFLILTRIVMDVLRLSVSSLLWLDLNHLHWRRGSCGNIDWDKPDGNVLGNFNNWGRQS